MIVVPFLFCFLAFAESTSLERISRATTTCLQQNAEILEKLKGIEAKIESCANRPPGCDKTPKNCAEVLACGGLTSGVYTVDPDGRGAFQVYCDQKTLGGGWTVFQRRQDGSVDFYKGWSAYKAGFGRLPGEHWLGLDRMNRLTMQTRNELRVDLEDTTGAKAHAQYAYFAVSAELSNYQLSLGAYKGTAGDSLSDHRGAPFSTKDRDNDSAGASCAIVYKGAWWYTACHSSNLNGKYYHGSHASYADGVNWRAWKGYHYSLKHTEMKIRPQGFIVPS